jgi:hypothetical protein
MRWLLQALPSRRSARQRASAALLQCLHSLAARTEVCFNESKSLSAEVKDFRLGLEISVIQAFADRIVRLLKVRDPLSETCICARLNCSPTASPGRRARSPAERWDGGRVQGRRPAHDT